MSTPRKLSASEVDERLSTITAWELVDGRIRRQFEFAGFSQAFAFMTRVALLAEKAHHHPDWSNSWNKVVVTLSSHDVRGLSQRDFDLARAIDLLLES